MTVIPTDDPRIMLIAGDGGDVPEFCALVDRINAAMAHVLVGVERGTAISAVVSFLADFLVAVSPDNMAKSTCDAVHKMLHHNVDATLAAFAEDAQAAARAHGGLN